MSKMNPCNDQDGAEKKFWGCPELMEQFLLYMDPATILSVASSQISSCCIVQILEDSDNPSIWNKLIRRSLKENNPEEEERRVKDLTKILKLMKSPKAPMMYLLEFICERNTPNCRTDPPIQLSCVCNPSGHSVSSRGMVLLEEVEGAFGSSEQQILKIKMMHMDEVGVLSAMSSRALRGSVIGKLVLYHVACDSLNFAKQFLNLLRRIGEVTGHCSLMPRPRELKVCGEVGREGWEMLGSALSLHPGVFNCVRTTKEVILRAQKQDLQKINLALSRWRKWFIMEKGECILHGSRRCCDRMYETEQRWKAAKTNNNKEWGLLEEFLAKAQKIREEGLE